MATKYVKIEKDEELVHALIMKGDTSTIEIAIVSKKNENNVCMYRYKYVMLVDDNDEFGKDNIIASSWCYSYGNALACAIRIVQSNVTFVFV